MVNVSVVRIMLEKPLEILQRVGQNTTTQLINQSKHSISKTILDICLVGPDYATPHLITKLEKTLKHCLLVLSNHL